MKQLKGHTEPKWWIATTITEQKTVVHYGKVEVGQKVTTGQKNLYPFDTKKEWITELKENYNIEFEDDVEQ